jgi:hypothetical protein
MVNEFRHDKDFIAVIKQIIAGKKSKEDLLFGLHVSTSLREAWAQHIDQIVGRARSDLGFPGHAPELCVRTGLNDS